MPWMNPRPTARASFFRGLYSRANRVVQQSAIRIADDEFGMPITGIQNLFHVGRN
jgi:hypothetical protein